MATYETIAPQQPRRECTILVAEDEPVLRMLISEFLTQSGFKVIEAGDAAMAISLIDANDIDLVFSDINMPGNMRGDGLADWLAARFPDMPVILTSGYHVPNTRCGARRFISKPYALAYVELQIREHLH